MNRIVTVLAFIPATAFVNTSLAAEVCPNATTTLEINDCLAKETSRAESDLNRYLAEARRLLSEQPQVVAALDRAQSSWVAYRDAECSAMYELYAQGTIRGAMFGGCKLSLTERRTHDVWETYIQPEHSPLPEPTAP